MLNVSVDIELTVKGPFITKSSSPGEYGIDSVAARDRSGTPYIAGTHLTGKLREALKELADIGSGPAQVEIDGWFGKESEPTGDNAPIRKRVRFDDFVAVAPDDGTRYRIRIDEDRGAVYSGAYQVIESLFAPGKEYSFKGRLRLWPRTRKNR